jgi:hypothetical protein
VTRRLIQPKAAVELETVTLRLPAPLVRAVEQCAKYLGGSTYRTHVITQAIEIALEQDPSRHRVAAVLTHLQNNVTAGGARSVPPASSRNTAVFTLALSTSLGGPFTFPRQ